MEIILSFLKKKVGSIRINIYLCKINFNRFNMEHKNSMMAVAALLAAIVMTGCTSTPRVIVDVVEQLPSLPADARPIGKVNVMEGDMTPADQCLYSNMLSLAVKKTAACGGNALHVDDHKRGGLTTKCHRIWGTMYLVPDSLLTDETPMSVAQLEEKHDQELLEMNSRKDSTQRKTYGGPTSILKVNCGPSIMTSELVAGSKTYKNETGFALDVDYQHLWHSGLGFGINYLYHKTSLESNYSIAMHYIGPSFVASHQFGQYVRVDGSLGIGCSFLREDYDTDAYAHVTRDNLEKTGIAFLAQLGIDFMATKHIGLGLQLNSYVTKLKRPKNVNTDRWSFYGVKQIDILFGARYYF